MKDSGGLANLKLLVKQKHGILLKGPVKLMEWVKIALLFLHVTLKLFQFMIMNLSGKFYIRLSKNFSKRFTNQSILTRAK